MLSAALHRGVSLVYDTYSQRFRFFSPHFLFFTPHLFLLFFVAHGLAETRFIDRSGYEILVFWKEK